MVDQKATAIAHSNLAFAIHWGEQRALAVGRPSLQR